jgi:hypothetical protein
MNFTLSFMIFVGSVSASAFEIENGNYVQVAEESPYRVMLTAKQITRTAKGFRSDFGILNHAGYTWSDGNPYYSTEYACTDDSDALKNCVAVIPDGESKFQTAPIVAKPGLMQRGDTVFRLRK